MSQIKQDDFIKYLVRKRDDRALMASLRRGLAQPNSVEVNRVVQNQLTEDSPPWLEDAYYVIAPLFAFHHRNGENDIVNEGNMGSHFRVMADSMKSSSDDEMPASVERRFMQLLACDANDLADLLRQVMSLLRSKNIAVNWQQLLQDVIGWRHSDDRRDAIRKEWSRKFWRANRTSNSSSNPQTNS